MRFTFSTALAATVRGYFGLSQAELALLLGVTASQIAHIEAGRHLFSEEVARRLQRLVKLMPPENVATAAVPLPMDSSTAPPVPLDVPAVQDRLRVCQVKAERRRRQLARTQTKTEQARRWLAALTQLLAEPTNAAAQPLDARLRPWLETQAELALARLAAEPTTAQALQMLRLRLLEAEVAELQQWLLGSRGNFTP
ncbi:helix-turn-helix transcriptional regulator [Hymenobacter sp. CRA2]|uniref:helix-turn-helix transcriptional regulator n=1 Tax=Hymenobacter sp. CRA2 TaxID=1955620 RepID=UPI0009C8C42D|nr:helix-turn-helix transcriptional regulator [Hymenobacter sp. CRA2]OON68216.1 hypothetical protein B0919_13745 [Hymenobacter sp. CRA2]